MRALQVDMGNGGLRNALATVDNGFSDKDVSNMLATGAGLAFGSLADSVAEGACCPGRSLCLKLIDTHRVPQCCLVHVPTRPSGVSESDLRNDMQLC